MYSDCRPIVSKHVAMNFAFNQDKNFLNVYNGEQKFTLEQDQILLSSYPQLHYNNFNILSENQMQRSNQTQIDKVITSCRKTLNFKQLEPIQQIESARVQQTTDRYRILNNLQINFKVKSQLEKKAYQRKALNKSKLNINKICDQIKIFELKDLNKYELV